MSRLARPLLRRYCPFTARAFGVPKASVQLLHGAAGRQKTLGIILADEKALQAAQALVAAWIKPDA